MMLSLLCYIVCNQLRLDPGIANDLLSLTSIWVADNERFTADHLMTISGDRLTDGCGVLVISIDQELSLHAAAKAVGEFSQLNVLHEAVVNELGLI